MGLFVWGVSPREVAIGFLVWYVLASFALTMNHRYFSHAAFKTSRTWRFVLACVTLLGCAFSLPPFRGFFEDFKGDSRCLTDFRLFFVANSMQFGPIWWSSKHRLHHKFCE